jgi:methyltransferase-like protein
MKIISESESQYPNYLPQGSNLSIYSTMVSFIRMDKNNQTKLRAVCYSLSYRTMRTYNAGLDSKTKMKSEAIIKIEKKKKKRQIHKVQR